MSASNVSVTINGVTVQAEKGRLLIDVAEEMGVFVPRFCYHPGMKSVAVCRMCLVQVEGQRKLLPACATPVDDGMNVNTVEESAVDAQSGMLEFLLINHPLDCPICDRAGECPLQDQTYRHGPGSSRYVEPKRTYEKALDISDLVVLDRERCVLCWRCVRFCEEISGDAFIQLVDRGAGTQILTFSDEPFDSYFSGNTIQICPVGALTSRPYRFVARPWDIQGAASVCGYCAVGCPITNETRSDKLVRCQAMPNEEVNDYWICDKGRFGYHYVSAQDRLKTPLVRNAQQDFEAASWGDALDAAADRLNGKKVGVLVGGHVTTEDAYAWGKLAKQVLKTTDVDSRIQDDGAPYELFAAAAGVAGSTATISDVARAGDIVWIGPDPKETLPVLYLRLRAAVTQNNARLTVVSPRRTSLDALAAAVVRVAPGDTPGAVEGLWTDGAGPGDNVVVCWGPASPGRDETASARAAIALARRHRARLLVCPPHAGSQGLIDMGVLPALDAGYVPAASPGRSTREMLAAASAGELDTLVVVGADVVADFPDAGLAEQALRRAAVVAVELFATETVSYADVVFPAAAYAEREGTFTNLERRIQKLEPSVPAPGTAHEPWKIAQRLAAVLGSEWEWDGFGDVWSDIKRNVESHANVDLDALAQPGNMEAPATWHEASFGPDPSHGNGLTAGPAGHYPKGFRQGAPFQTGYNWPLSWELRAFEARQRPGVVPVPGGDLLDTDGDASGNDVGDGAAAGTEAASQELELLTGRMIYDSGTMISHSTALHALAKRPYVEINADDLAAVGASDGDEILVSAGDVEQKLVAVASDIAPGTVFIPYDQPGLRANKLMSGRNARVAVRSA